MFMLPSKLFHLAIADHVIRPNNCPHPCKCSKAKLGLRMVPTNLTWRCSVSVSADDARELAGLAHGTVQASGDVHARKTFKGNILNGISFVGTGFPENGVQWCFIRKCFQAGAF